MEKEFIDGLGLDPQTAEAILAEHQKVVSHYEARLQAMAVDAAVKQAVAAAGGRNLTAIRALLDEDALAQDPENAARQAVAAVKRENPYLFGGMLVTAPGTGSAGPLGYSQEELARLPLSEYRRYRKAASGR